MATLRLDLDGLIVDLGDSGGGDAIDSGVAPGTRMGHVHLQVADVDAAETFYHGVLGFDVTVRGYPGALFLSAGGYHHHIGLNTWNSAGSPPPVPGAIGLRSFDVVLEDQPELERLLARDQSRGSARLAAVRWLTRACARSLGQRAGPARRLTEATGAQLPFGASATWRSGYAAACKAVYTGSIPVVASGGRGLYSPPRAAVAQLARASACHAEGRGFESLQPLWKKLPFLRGFFRFSTLVVGRRKALGINIGNRTSA